MQKGLTPAVYAASTEAIALKEVRHNFSLYGVKPRQNPRVLIDLELDLNAIIPMPAVLEDLPWPSLDELLDEDWEAVNDSGMESLSQAFGRALWELEYEGLRVPSTRDRRGSNLVWFPERLKPESEITIVGKAELNRWIAK